MKATNKHAIRRKGCKEKNSTCLSVTNHKTWWAYPQSKKKSDCVAALGRPGGNLALIESQKANVLLETFRGIFRSPDEVPVNLGIAETDQIPEIPELFGT